MEKITIELRPEAIKPKDLEVLRGEVSKEITIEIEEQKPPKRPIISASPLDGELLQNAYKLSQELLSAESILKISGGLVLRNIFDLAYKKIKSSIIELIKVNNRKKGNKFGAEIVIYRQLSNGMQKCRFIFDDIYESKISSALSQINSTLTVLEQADNGDYLEGLEIIIFKYNRKGAWETITTKEFE